jgi:hypothetical protein
MFKVKLKTFLLKIFSSEFSFLGEEHAKKFKLSHKILTDEIHKMQLPESLLTPTSPIPNLTFPLPLELLQNCTKTQLKVKDMNGNF